MSEAAGQTQPLLLITYPRTASNLLMRMICLPEQEHAVCRENGGYFFHPAFTNMNRAGLMRRPRAEWTEDEVAAMRQMYQSCYDDLQKLLDSAARQGKMAVTKEHAPFIMSPTTISDYLDDSLDNGTIPWRVAMADDAPPQAQGCRVMPLRPNLSVMPCEFLLRFRPAFLIRHPALAFPSYYRLVLSFCSGDMAKVEEKMVPFVAISCTLRWTRQLYDWYTAAWTTVPSWGARRPILLDADDILDNPDLVLRFCSLTGLDRAKAKFRWDPFTEEEQSNVDSMRAKTRHTLHTSSGITMGKTFKGLTIDGEADKWKAEFGELVGARIEGWVRAAMPDYAYLVSQKLAATP